MRCIRQGGKTLKTPVGQLLNKNRIEVVNESYLIIDLFT